MRRAIVLLLVGLLFVGCGDEGNDDDDDVNKGSPVKTELIDNNFERRSRARCFTESRLCLRTSPKGDYEQ